MTRIAVIGNAGGGKSTLCARLGKALQLPVYPIDKIQWQPGWVATSREEFKRQHDAWLALDRWIIDGWGPWDAIVARFEAADTIIFVDHPLFVHYRWALKRQLQCVFRPRPDGPEGCPMLPMTWPLLRMIWTIQWSLRPRLYELVNTFGEFKRVIHLRSPRALEQFLRVYR